jgi:hypothetical protein
VFVQGEYGQVHDGRPVYNNYQDRIHCATEPLVPVQSLELVVGMDWGLNPAAIFTQMSSLGMVMCYDELAPEDVTFEDFVNEQLVPLILEKYRNFRVRVAGDPAGSSRNALSQKTVYDILRERGIAAAPARTNDFLLRRDAVDYFLKRTGGFLIDPSCTTLREGFSGGYRYAKQTERAQRDPRPEKNHFSHVHDALQYAALDYYQGVTQPTRGRRPVTTPKRPFLYV